MFKRDQTMSSNIDNYYALTNEHNLKDVCIHPIKKINKHALPNTISKEGGSNFNPVFLYMC